MCSQTTWNGSNKNYCFQGSSYCHILGSFSVFTALCNTYVTKRCPCTPALHHKGIWQSKGLESIIMIASHLLYPVNGRLGGLQSLSGCFEERNILLLYVKNNSLCHPACTLVNTLTYPSENLHYLNIFIWCHEVFLALQIKNQGVRIYIFQMSRPYRQRIYISKKWQFFLQR